MQSIEIEISPEDKRPTLFSMLEPPPTFFYAQDHVVFLSFLYLSRRGRLVLRQSLP